MATLIDAIDIKRKTYFEFENAPYYCLDAEVNTPSARGAQTLVRLKMRNLLTSAVFEKTFKASDKFKEPDLQIGPASYLYSDKDGSHFLDQETYETISLSDDMIGDAWNFLVEGCLIQLHKYNGNPIGIELPPQVELTVTYAEPGARGDSPAAASPRPSSSKPASRFACHCSSKRARRSRSQPRRASSPAAPKRTPVPQVHQTCPQFHLTGAPGSRPAFGR